MQDYFIAILQHCIFLLCVDLPALQNKVFLPLTFGRAINFFSTKLMLQLLNNISFERGILLRTLQQGWFVWCL